MTNALGVRTELDLRVSSECAGLDGSPLGPNVRRVQVSSGCYSQMDEPWAKEACRIGLACLAEAENLPILVHCSSGQDRTGTLAFLVNGLLGVSPDDLARDWEASALWKDEHDWFNRNNTYAALLSVMARYPGAIAPIRESPNAFAVFSVAMRSASSGRIPREIAVLTI